MKRYIVLLALTIAGAALRLPLRAAQFPGGTGSWQEIAPDSARWEVRAEETRVEEFLGRQSLLIHNGAAAVKDSLLTDGVIEFDIAFTGERGYMGAAFRVLGGGNNEEFYVRPHQSGNPDANQYTPVFHGLPGWQLYYGEDYGAPVRYASNTWIPVRIVLSGSRAEIYISDMTTPALYVPELKRPVAAGRVGLTANAAPAHFSRFRYMAMSTPPALVTLPRPRDAAATPAGTVMAWSVSDTVDEKSLDTKYALSAGDLSARKWTRLDCERTGVCNLARVQGIGPDRTKNTAFARLTITAEREQVKKLRFGFSDRVKVYVNGTLVYGGQDNYRSRDYRFLGTMGLFDELYLPLRKGANEVVFAVSEDFGGWGIQGLFDDPSGITWK